MWRNTAELIPVIPGRDSYGEDTRVDGVPRMVFVNRKSVRQSEFYQAFAAGMKPEIVYEIRTVEYQEEPKLRAEGIDYYIIRTFTKNGEITELICSRYPMEG
jgi:hypothetical protein